MEALLGSEQKVFEPFLSDLCCNLELRFPMGSKICIIKVFNIKRSKRKRLQLLQVKKFLILLNSYRLGAECFLYSYNVNTLFLIYTALHIYLVIYYYPRKSLQVSVYAVLYTQSISWKILLFEFSVAFYII